MTEIKKGDKVRVTSTYTADEDTTEQEMRDVGWISGVNEVMKVEVLERHNPRTTTRFRATIKFEFDAPLDGTPEQTAYGLENGEEPERSVVSLIDELLEFDPRVYFDLESGLRFKVRPVKK